MKEIFLSLKMFSISECNDSESLFRAHDQWMSCSDVRLISSLDIFMSQLHYQVRYSVIGQIQIQNQKCTKSAHSSLPNKRSMKENMRIAVDSAPLSQGKISITVEPWYYKVRLLSIKQGFSAHTTKRHHAIIIAHNLCSSSSSLPVPLHLKIFLNKDTKNKRHLSLLVAPTCYIFLDVTCCV